MDFIEKALYWLVVLSKMTRTAESWKTSLVLLGGKCVLRDTSGGMAIVDNEWHI